jgi:hypothetical protein
MIDVCMREHDCIDFINRHRNAEVLLLALGALTLKEPAVEDDGLAANAENVTRPRNLPRGTDEFDLHNSLEDGGRESTGVRA